MRFYEGEVYGNSDYCEIVYSSNRLYNCKKLGESRFTSTKKVRDKQAIKACKFLGGNRIIITGPIFTGDRELVSKPGYIYSDGKYLHGSSGYTYTVDRDLYSMDLYYCE